MSLHKTIALTSLIGLSLFGWSCHKEINLETQAQFGSKPPVQKAVEKTATTTAPQIVEEPEPLAYLLFTEGAKVKVSRGDKSREGIAEMELYAGDKIEVTAGEARLLYPDTGITVLEEGTLLTLLPDGEPAEGGIGVRLKLEAGKIWTRLQRLLGSGENMSVDAGGVVATVRGTGFGVKYVNGDLDITVSDHQIKVEAGTVLNTGKKIAESVTLSAGNGLKLKPTEITKMTDIRSTMLKGIRALNATEKMQPGYVFGARALKKEEMVRPAGAFRWSVPPVLDKMLRQDLGTAALGRWEALVSWFSKNQDTLMKNEQNFVAPAIIRFQPPLRQIELLEITAPSSTPSIKGPLISS